MILNVGGGSAGYSLIVTVTGTFSGASVNVTNGTETFTKTVDSSGKASFNNLATGAWTVTATNHGVSKSTTVTISGDSSVSIALRYMPVYTYSGSSKLVDDADGVISDPDSYVGNWKLRFLTSGTLEFTALNSASNGIDVFCVGGGGSGGGGSQYWGGGGGGGGYTKTYSNVSLETNVQYAVTIGAGGAAVNYNNDDDSLAVGKAGGTTSFAGNYSANGGKLSSTTNSKRGGKGGSGGGGGHRYDNGGAGGTNGGNGKPTTDTTNMYLGGTGQGTTTREFGESAGNLYASGGKAGNGSNKTAAAGASGSANTGNGGGGSTGAKKSGAGGSGIVVIRNKRG